jgi:XrtJ-associated TM-motif-TM protein
MKKLYFAMLTIAFLVMVHTAHADIGGDTGDGCDSSPENPTLILAAIGSSGAGLAALRVRLAGRRNRK